MAFEFTSRSGRHILLRPPQEGDVEVMFAYITKLSQEDTYILVNPDEPVTFREEVQYLESSLAKMHAGQQVHYLALHAGELIGSSQISLLGRRKNHSGSFGITLSQNYRHDGIGTILADFVMAEAKKKLGITLVTLEVFASNNIAQNLYRKLGFKEYGHLPQGLRYKDGYDDAVLMFKQL